MQAADLAGRAVKPLAISALIVGLLLPAPMRAEAAAAKCVAQMDVVRLASPLTRVARKLSAGEPITIVAIGSSSTAGAGASSPAASYPSRLAVELKRHFPSHAFAMINSGVNGEEVPDMLKRFDSTVIANKPDLVLWQLGTNSLIRDHAMSDRGALIREGVHKARSAGADVVLIDPQFAPKVIAKPLAGKMVDFIAATAKREDVALFRRFDAMKRWSEIDRLPFATFLVNDGLHLNDWGYACMAKGLGMAIAEAAQRPVMSAKVTPNRDGQE